MSRPRKPVQRSRHFVGLLRGTRVADAPDVTVLTLRGRRALVLRGLSHETRDSIRLLGGRGCDLETFVGIAAPADPAAIASRMLLLKSLAAVGLLRHVLSLADACQAEAEPLNPRFAWRDEVPSDSVRYLLAPGTVLRPDSGRWLAEATLAHVRVRLFAPAALTLLTASMAGATLRDLERALQSLATDSTRALLAFLLGSGLIVVEGDDAATGWGTWRDEDLSFHRRTRYGFFPEPLGSSGRKVAAAKPRGQLSPPLVALPVATGGCSGDPSLFAVLARRRSLRLPAREAIDAARLSNFLEAALRDMPFPRLGGLDVFDFYLVIGRCRGVPAGLYRYRPQEHGLEPCAAASRYRQAMLEQTAQALGNAGEVPDVVIKIVVDVATVTQAYDRIAYRLALLNAGIIMQTMYLVATALGLAPCAIGTGDALEFGSQAGLDPRLRDVVAEFSLSDATAV